MTDELRAKFDLLPCPFCGGDATITEQSDEDGRFAAVVCWTCGAGSRQHYFCGDDAREHVAGAWNKRSAHASRDAEVEALKKRIEDAPIYYIPTEKPTDQDGWVQVIGSVKAINNMRGKHVRLVIDDAMREGK